MFDALIRVVNMSEIVEIRSILVCPNQSKKKNTKQFTARAEVFVYFQFLISSEEETVTFKLLSNYLSFSVILEIFHSEECIIVLVSKGILKS